MNRRTFLTAALGVPALAAFVVACGDATVEPGTSVPDTSGGGILHPTGADDVVVRIAYEGGFTAPDAIFARVPTLLVSGDGRAIEQGVVPTVFPGPLLPSLMERSIDEVGVQAVLQAAKDAGLLAAPPDYSLPDGIGIADAPDTVVTIAANGTVYEHRAYALGIDGSTPARDRLLAFVTAMSDLGKVAGPAHVGDSAVLVASAYRFRATPGDPSQITSEPTPTIVPWPASTGIHLADAAECAVLDAASAGRVFLDANQLTFFDDGGVTYTIAVVQVLPGDQPC